MPKGHYGTMVDSWHVPFTRNVVCREIDSNVKDNFQGQPRQTFLLRVGFEMTPWRWSRLMGNRSRSPLRLPA